MKDASTYHDSCHVQSGAWRSLLSEPEWGKKDEIADPTLEHFEAVLTMNATVRIELTDPGLRVSVDAERGLVGLGITLNTFSGKHTAIESSNRCEANGKLCHTCPLHLSRLLSYAKISHWNILLVALGQQAVVTLASWTAIKVANTE